MACPICNNIKTEEFWNENSFQGNKCMNCDLVFITNKPTKAELSDYYNCKSKEELSINKSTLMKEKTCEYSLRQILKMKKNGNLLELGPGFGVFLSKAQSYGFNVSGIEINKKQVDYLVNELKIRVEEGLFGDIVSEIPSNRFDVIYHWDVLSHMYNPINIFRESNRILKSDGLLVFETGNFGKISRFWYRLRKEVDYPEHLFFFSHKSISLLLANSGFKIIKKYKISIAPLIIMNALIKNKKKTKELNISGEKNKNFINKTITNFLFYFSVFLGKIQPSSFPAKELYIAVKSN